MHMSALFRNTFARVAGATHRRNDLARSDGVTLLEAAHDFTEMRVKGEDFQTVDCVPKHNVIPIVRSRGSLIDVGDGAGARRHHGVSRLAALTPMQAANVETLVHLRAVASHTAERAALPRLARSADEERLLRAFLENSSIRRGELKN